MSTFAVQLRSVLEPHYCKGIRSAAAHFLCYENFPSPCDYSELARNKNIISGGGAPVRFVPEPKRYKRHGFKRLYQPRIFLNGEVSARPNHWHDFFDMLVWCSFPKAKAALNRRHFFAFDEVASFPWSDPPPLRTPEQDALTLFDEGGVIVGYRDAELFRQGVACRFSQNFVLKFGHQFCFFIFGHAIYEEIVKGHRNVVGSGVGVNLNENIGYLDGHWSDQQKADALTALAIGNRAQTLRTKDFVPISLTHLDEILNRRQTPPFRI